MFRRKKEKDAPEVPPAVVELRREGDIVRIFVDSRCLQELPVGLYESIRQKLSGAPDRMTNGFMLAIGAEDAPRHLLLRFPPADELSAEPLPLQTGDGERYGRRYRIEIIEVGTAASLARILDARTGAETASMKWDEFAKRATADLWRSDTSYREMLGECDPKRHLKLLARRYRPPAKESHSDRPAPKKERKSPEADAEPTPPPRDPRKWLNRHPSAAVALMVVGVILVFVGLSRALSPPPPVYSKSTASTARQKETIAIRLNRHEAVANRFELLAVEDPERAREALYELRRFLLTAEAHQPTKDQQQRIEKLKKLVPKLERILSRIAQP